MPTGRQSPCLLCKARQAALVRRRTNTITKRTIQTQVAIPPEDDPFFFARSNSSTHGTCGIVLRRGAKFLQWETHELLQNALSFEALYQHRDHRVSILRGLSNPWPPAPHGRQQHAQSRSYIPEASAGVIPHEVFRIRVKNAIGPKSVRQVLRQQLLQCERPKEILRVVAVAMQDRGLAENLAVLHEPIMHALYRCRQHVSDPEVLRTLNIIITRFRYAKIYIQPMLVFMALKFAARSRSLAAMKRHLKIVHEENIAVSSSIFRSVIAKFSIGHRGLGEIRNGRWNRRELLQVLYGFDDAKHLPTEQQYHFGSFLERSDWQYLHGWVAVLARCKDSEGIWREWSMWKESDSRTNPKTLLYREGAAIITSRLRGDYWFVEQMTYSGDIEKAWRLLVETGISFNSLKNRVKDKLLENIEFATIWDDKVRAEMTKKYDRDLRKIEGAFGVRWVSTGSDGQGQHELIMDQEEALDKLAEHGSTLDEDYGYPWETSPIVPESERTLHEATEG